MEFSITFIVSILSLSSRRLSDLPGLTTDSPTMYGLVSTERVYGDLTIFTKKYVSLANCQLPRTAYGLVC